MKIPQILMVLSLALGAAPAFAAAPVYPTEQAAKAACQDDDVVYIDLDRWRFYRKGAARYGKTEHGAYSCAKAASTDFMDAKEYPLPEDTARGG